MKNTGSLGVALVVITALICGESFARVPIGPRKWARGIGAGCPTGTVQYIESPDGQTISVLFDRFQVESGKPNGPIKPASQCDVILPFQVPAGQKLRAVQLDYRGFASIPKPGQFVTLTSTHRIQNRRGRAQADLATDIIRGPSTGEFTFTQNLRDGWSGECGEDLEFKVGILLRATSLPRLTEPVTASLDSLDSQVSLTYRLKFGPCSTLPPPMGPGPVKPIRPPHRHWSY